MRKLMTTLAAFAAAALFAATSANAAARWSCDGADYVCGGADTSVAQPKAKAPKTNEDASEATSKRPARQAHAKKHQETANNSSDDDQPVRRKARRAHVARAVTEDDAPAPKHRAHRSVATDEGGGSSFSGKASYYWEPQALASGGRFNPNAMTAAHKTLPFGTRVRVTNQHNGQSVDVVINDRGPYIAGRVIDLSKAAAQAISMTGSGVVPVSVRILGRG